MSGLWVLEERMSAGEPILDLWEPKSGHFRFQYFIILIGGLNSPEVDEKVTP